MAQIKLLSDGIINKIAAGEVVDRPASVVKELLENALDAGADQMTILVENGGHDLMTVLDNGCGMSPEDARLACIRHATSKITGEDDLAHIHTLGFRGEALASMASVSRLELVTCADEAQGGTRVELEGGREVFCGPVGFARGTRVSVRDVFFNTPARRKFLRTPAAEFQHIQTAVIHAALPRPGHRFKLVHNGKAMLDLPPVTSLAERAYQVFGAELQEGMVAVSAQEGGLQLEGLACLPSQAKATRRWQYLFVNGRAVKHQGLNHAVYHGYRTLLMKDRHPAYILLLTLDPSLVDVNVHPAKTEIRLQNPQWLHTVLADKLHKAVLEGARKAAFGSPAPELSPARKARQSNPASQGRPGGQMELAMVAAQEQVRSPYDQATPPEDMPQGDFHFRAHRTDMGRIRADGSVQSAMASARPALASIPSNSPSPAPVDLPPVGLELDATITTPAALMNPLRVLAQFERTYLLVQRGDDLLVVDQHAAHERLLFEKYRQQLHQGRLVREPYLVPLTLELGAQNALLLEQYLPQWEKLGFVLEPFGANTFVVREVPVFFRGRDVKQLVLEVLDELALFGQSGRLDEVTNEILERVACHAAIRAGQALSFPEMEALMAQLAQLDIALYCPHGRPVWVEISQHELEKRFKRIV